MKPENSTFRAVGFDPDGNELSGAVSFTLETLRFEFEGGDWELSLADLEIEQLTLKTVSFSSPAHPRHAIHCEINSLDHPTFTRKAHLRPIAKEIFQRCEGLHRLKITLVASFALLFLIVIGAQMGSWLMSFLVASVPVKWELNEGEKVYSEVLNSGLLVTNEAAQAQLEFIGAALAKRIPEKRFEFKFHLIAIPEPNAFAIPGGHVFITTGLLRFVKTPEELAGVMAHELAHVTLRHHFRQTITTAGPYHLLHLFFSDRDTFVSTFSSSYQFLMTQSFSRDYEEAADRVAWDYLLAANISPEGVQNCFERLLVLDEKDPIPSVEAFSDHPLVENRIKVAQARWEKLSKARKVTFRDLLKEVPGSFPPDVGKEPLNVFEILRRLQKGP